MDFALRMTADIAGSIALPVIVLAWAGRRLDLFAGSGKPRFVAIGILMAFILSTVIVCQKAVRYGEKYVEITEEESDGERGPPRSARDRLDSERKLL